MTIKIVKTDETFDFSAIKLHSPSVLHGQVFFSKISHSNQDLFLQSPAVTLKNGFINEGKMSYSDIVISDTDDEFISWIETLEESLHTIVLQKSKEWFTQEISRSHVEHTFTPPLRTYKKGKFFLMRVQNDPPRNIVFRKSKIYDEFDNVIEEKDVKPTDTLVCILHLNGIKFTTNSFQIYIELKQSIITNRHNNPFASKVDITTTNSPIDNVNLNDDDSEENSIIRNENEGTYNIVKENNNINVETNTEQGLVEANIKTSSIEDSNIKLRQDNLTNDNETYVNYVLAKNKAKEARQSAMKMIADAKNARNQCMIENIDFSESDDDSFYSSDDDDESDITNDQLQSESDDDTHSSEVLPRIQIHQ